MEIKKNQQKLVKKVSEKQFLPYFVEKLLLMLRIYVIEPCGKGKVDRGWTNNNSESGSHILNAATRWKRTDIPNFIHLLDDTVKGSAWNVAVPSGESFSEFSDMFQHHQVDIDKWSNMTQESNIVREKSF